MAVTPSGSVPNAIRVGARSPRQKPCKRPVPYRSWRERRREVHRSTARPAPSHCRSRGRSARPTGKRQESSSTCNTVSDRPEEVGTLVEVEAVIPADAGDDAHASRLQPRHSIDVIQRLACCFPNLPLPNGFLCAPFDGCHVEAERMECVRLRLVLVHGAPPKSASCTAAGAISSEIGAVGSGAPSTWNRESRIPTCGPKPRSNASRTCQAPPASPCQGAWILGL